MSICKDVSERIFGMHISPEGKIGILLSLIGLAGTGVITVEPHMTVVGWILIGVFVVGIAWLAYSHFERGAWNLWIRNQKTGETERIGNVPCNEIEPGWESDSKTLLYSTDCGRSLWFTAVARRQVIR